MSNNSDRIPESGGIYKVLKDKGESGKLTRVYLGKAADLRRQYNYHMSESEENICLKDNLRKETCYFRYALLSGEENRQDSEDHLLQNGSYECNVQGQ